MCRKHIHCLGFFCLLLCVSGCQENTKLHPEPKNTDQLKILAYYSTADNEQGYSPAKTAAEAAQQVNTVKEILAHYNVTIKIVEDADNMADASKRARQIQMDPSVLAVVGHSRSDITLAALPHYANAGIPVLVPSATSPYVPYSFDLNMPWPDVDDSGKPIGSDRFSRVFRLLPKDVPDQVNAIAATTLRLLPKTMGGTTKKVMLVCDVTKGSSIYVKPICEALLHHSDLSSRISSYRKFDLDTGDIYGLVTEIHAVKSKHIIVIAYPQTARELLQEINERAPQVNEKISDYTFIFPDACMTAAQDLLGFGARIFITSPVQPIEKTTPATKILQQHIRDGKATLTQECYTFDALLMLVESLQSESCKEHISRDCIAEALEKRKHQTGCGEYRFMDGEREIPSYHIFAGCSGNLSDVGAAEKDSEKSLCNEN